MPPRMGAAQGAPGLKGYATVAGEGHAKIVAARKETKRKYYEAPPCASERNSDRAATVRSPEKMWFAGGPRGYPACATSGKSCACNDGAGASACQPGAAATAWPSNRRACGRSVRDGPSLRSEWCDTRPVCPD